MMKTKSDGADIPKQDREKTDRTRKRGVENCGAETVRYQQRLKID